MIRPKDAVTVQAVGFMFLALFLARPMLRFCHRFRVERQLGAVPENVIFVANHRSFLDPIIVGAFCDRPIRYFARANLWKYPVVGSFLRFFGGFPIDRDEPQVAVMKRTVAALKNGDNMILFPEGTRTRTGRMGTIRDGAALFARRSGAAVVPLYINRSERVWPRGAALPRLAAKSGLVVGPMLRAPAELSGRKADAWLMQAIRDWLTEQERRLLGPDGASS